MPVTNYIIYKMSYFQYPGETLKLLFHVPEDVVSLQLTREIPRSHELDP